MPEDAVIVDTGPLVAALIDTEEHHQWAVEQVQHLHPPLLTCEPVITEAFHLLGRFTKGRERLLQLLKSSALKMDFRIADELEPLHQLVVKYADLPMSLADACLVRMAELNSTASVFTLDHHFRIYRKNGRQQIRLIAPEGM